MFHPPDHKIQKMWVGLYLPTETFTICVSPACKTILSKKKEIFYHYSTRGFLCGTKTKLSTEKATGL